MTVWRDYRAVMDEQQRKWDNKLLRLTGVGVAIAFWIYVAIEGYPFK